jgi:hypothetical protein
MKEFLIEGTVKDIKKQLICAGIAVVLGFICRLIFCLIKLER